MRTAITCVVVLGVFVYGYLKKTKKGTGQKTSVM